MKEGRAATDAARAAPTASAGEGGGGRGITRSDVLLLAVFGVCDPPLPDEPAEEGEDRAVADECDVGNALLNDSDESNDEDYDGADMLDDDGRVGDERPEIVGLEARVSLKLLEESGLIGVVVGV